MAKVMHPALGGECFALLGAATVEKAHGTGMHYRGKIAEEFVQLRRRNVLEHTLGEDPFRFFCCNADQALR